MAVKGGPVTVIFMGEHTMAFKCITFFETIMIALLVAAFMPLRVTAEEAKSAAGKAIAVELVLAEASDPSLLPEAEGETPAEISADRVKQLQKEDKLTSWFRVRMASLENCPAYVQLGERVPVATGQAMMGFRSREGNAVTTQYSTVNVGTVVKVTARIEDGGTIVVDLDLERSRLANQPPPARTEGSPRPTFVPSKTETIMTQTTVRLTPGKTAVVAAHRSTAPKPHCTWVMVTAELLDNP